MKKTFISLALAAKMALIAVAAMIAVQPADSDDHQNMLERCCWPDACDPSDPGCES